MTGTRRPADWRLVLVTDADACGDRSIVDVVDAALASHALDAVVVRARTLSPRDYFALVSQVMLRASRTGTAVIAHDRADVALGLRTAGVHVPAHGLSPAFVRDILPHPAVIGASCHSASDVRAAEAGGADYVFLGPVFETPSKRAFGAPLGLDVVRAVRAASRIPILAIGGIEVGTAPDVCAAGASGIAVIRAVCATADPAEAVRVLRAAVDGARTPHAM